MKNIFTIFAIALGMLVNANQLRAQSIIPLQQGKPTSIRGLSVVNDNVAWVSGSKGHIAITRDGGETWSWQQVNGFENADFRDIEAFSDKEAIIMSSGTPALILKTVDGGENWQVKYRNNDSTFFLDAMDFSDHILGYILGDPIDNKFLLLETKDAGESWRKVKNAPSALPGEAAFAASGTCLRVNGLITIVTGGTSSRMLISPEVQPAWIATLLPLKNGKQSCGAFSVAYGNRQTIVVGGDYANDSKKDSVVYIQTETASLKRKNMSGGIKHRSTHTRHTSASIFSDLDHPIDVPDVTVINLGISVTNVPIDSPIKKGRLIAESWGQKTKGPSGFQSCVEYIQNNIFVSTGTPGSNITFDGGKTWKKIDDTSYNVCRKAKHGKLVLFAGNGGKIGVLKM
jgi:photosystem II stability/assembly factor-like uncharacterized protein